MELVTPRLRLREFVERDLKALREMDSRPEMHTYEKDFPSEAETRQSLREAISTQKELPRTNYRFAITVKPSNTVKGIVKLTRQYEAIREWEIGWAVHPDEWGKGYATEAAWQVMDWAFCDLKVHCITAYCHIANAASVRVMEKLGLRLDGRLRETRWLNGAWWDEYVYAILENEWQKNRDLTGFVDLTGFKNL